MAGQPTLVITELFLPTKGGTAVWFDQVYRCLGGKEQHILTAKVAGDAQHDADHPNHIHRLTLRRVSWLRPESLLMYLNLFFHSLWLCLRHRITSIHAGRVLPEGAIALICSRIFRIPCIVYAHGEEITTWRQNGKFKAMTWVYRHCDRIIANSEFTQQALLELGVAKDKITLIHPGVDIEVFRPTLACADLKAQLAMTANTPLLLSVGRLSRRKGFDHVIQALSELKQANLTVHYALIGIGEDLDYLTNLAKEQGVAKQVHFLGHVAADDLPRWYNACDVFVMPNREVNGDTEGFGMVYIEAAACGKTAISGCVGGPPNAVLHQQTGLNVDGENIQALSQAIQQLLQDVELRERLAKQAMARATNELSWPAVAKQTRQLLNNMAS